MKGRWRSNSKLRRLEIYPMDRSIVLRQRSMDQRPLVAVHVDALTSSTATNFNSARSREQYAMLLYWGILEPPNPSVNLAAVRFSSAVRVRSISIFPTGAQSFQDSEDVTACVRTIMLINNWVSFESLGAPSRLPCIWMCSSTRSPFQDPMAARQSRRHRTRSCQLQSHIRVAFWISA